MMPEALTALPVPRWVIADTHIGHANILTYSPWRQDWARDLRQHDERIIDAWNHTVGPDDWVLHLGDFALGTPERILAVRRRLLGRICLVRGNHDRFSVPAEDLGFDMAVSAGEIRTDTGHWLCVHDPARIASEQVFGTIMVLHGHLHGNTHRGPLPKHLRGRAIDCGVDAVRRLAPVPWSDIGQRRPAARKH
jgi:calcineurin-like phosphoesterase family protein